MNTERRLAEGRRVVGCKIGLTARAVQAQLGVDQPDFGVLFDDMSFGDAEPIPMQRLHQPKVEAEIAFVLEGDLTKPEATLAELISAIAYALPAVEIVGSRIENWNIKLLDTIADNASSGLFVLGSQPRKLEALDLRLCGMAMERRGEPVSVGARPDASDELEVEG